MSFLDDLFGSVKTAVQSTAAQVPVTVRTNLNAAHPIVMAPMGQMQPGPPNPVMLYLQPEITVGLPTGNLVYAPYGTPGRDDWKELAFGLGLSALAFMGLGAMIRIPWVLTLLAAGGAGGIYMHLAKVPQIRV